MIIQLQCENCDIIEKNLIIIFKESFKQRTDIGTEYFVFIVLYIIYIKIIQMLYLNMLKHILLKWMKIA